MKLCKDCKHFREAQAGNLFGMMWVVDATCENPDLVTIEPVRGSKRFPSPVDARHVGCGPEGLLWEGKSDEAPSV